MLRPLSNYLKTKTEDGQIESFYRSTGRRKTSHQNSEHDLDEQINEWANMTGFLCALGGVCLQKGGSNKLIIGLPLNPEPKKGSGKLLESLPCLSNSNQDVQYSPVAQFIFNLLRLLTCNNERFGSQIQKHIQELVGHEMSPALYPILFDQIKSIVEKFFDQGQAILLDINTQFIEHTILIMKNVLDSKADKRSDYLGMTSIEGMTLAIVRYVRYLDMSVHSIRIKTNLCQLVESMMKRRDDLAFRQEMKFRNKLVEYLTDWIMDTTHPIPAPSNVDITLITRYRKNINIYEV